MNKLLKSLIFLRLVDAHDNTLSLTNIALIVTITKLALIPNASFGDVSTLLLALAAYQFKKHINKQQPTVDDSEVVQLKSNFEDLKNQLGKLKTAFGLKQLGQ